MATAEGILVPASKFVGGGFTDALMMFDRAGQLRWSAPLGAGPEPEYVSPVVSDGTVFAVVQGQGWPRVAAFDANGVQGCSGTPRVCSAKWSTDPASGGLFQIAARGGQLFRADSDEVSVFDSAGVSGCSGGICHATWTTSQSGPHLTVTATTLVIAGGDAAFGFSVRPSGCSGTPLVCSPIWRGGYPAGHQSAQMTPTTAGGVAYVPLSDGIATYAVDGLAGCSAGAPRNCSALSLLAFPYAPRAPIVVGGLAYVVRLIGARPSGPPLDVRVYALP